MAQPSYLQTLENGKLLTKSNFPEFVPTWNYVINRLENLKGDRDANPESGKITLDTSDPEHPIIRFVKDEKDSSGGESGVISIIGENLEEINGVVMAQGADGSGLQIKTTCQSEQSGTLEVDVEGREEGEEFAPREITMGEQTVAKVFGTTDFEITQKTLLAGQGIKLEESSSGITISTNGTTSLSGYSGTRSVLLDVDYNNHNLRKKYALETWENGVLKSTVDQGWETYHTAVQETI